MAQHNQTGKEGEERAQQYLIQNGYTIKATNWRFGKEEIDIIAEHKDYLAIIEVKTRSSDGFGNPEEFVSKAKQKHLIRAAAAYAEKHKITKDIYFDIIAIVLKPTFKLEHIKEAFYP